MMKPKLIIINGPLGSGKSTLAKRYADDHPLTLLLDIDHVRSFISGWREYDKESAQTAKYMATEMARINLAKGHDVIIPQIYRHQEQYTVLENLANDCQASLYEFLLDISKEEAIKRFIDRGIA